MPDHQVTIVDIHDRVIGQKLRSARTKDDIYRITALWLTNSQGEILLAQRAANKEHNPNRWGPAAAGTVEARESYEENVYKEAEEEIGLSGIKFTPSHKVLIRTEHRYFCMWYTAKVDQPAEEFRLQTDEVQAVRWVTPTELVQDLRDHPERYTPSAVKGWARLITP
jgi:isopentenyl-diphosphate delta-isomerase